jgi:hypothetical protein
MGKVKLLGAMWRDMRRLTVNEMKDYNARKESRIV